MRVSIVGSGYVGTTVASCFAEMGHDVTAVDADERVVKQVNRGESPIHEPGVPERIAEYCGDALTATTEYADIRDTEVTFLALPTPAKADGSIDTSIIEAGAEQVANVVEDGHVVVTKSTVVPTTTADRLTPLFDESVEVAVNPEFLREGSAVEDFRNPDKLVFGARSERAVDVLKQVYQPLIHRVDPPVVVTGIEEAEMMKYANNAFLASKVSLINDIGNICKEYGVDAYEVAEAIGLDARISERFLRSGLGWGGSCFEKDVGAIRAAAREQGYAPRMLDAACAVNDDQPNRMLDLLDRHVDVRGEQVAVLGLSFKPETNDIRNSRAIPLIRGLQARGAEVVAFDPVASDEMRDIYPDIQYAESGASAVAGASAALVVTAWPEIASMDSEFDRMETPVVVDGRRAIDRRDGIVYEGLTW